MKQARYVHVKTTSLIVGDDECVDFCLEDHIDDFLIFTNEEVGSRATEISTQDYDWSKTPMSIIGETTEDSLSERIYYDIPNGNFGLNVWIKLDDVYPISFIVIEKTPID